MQRILYYIFIYNILFEGYFGALVSTKKEHKQKKHFFYWSKIIKNDSKIYIRTVVPLKKNINIKKIFFIIPKLSKMIQKFILVQ